MTYPQSILLPPHECSRPYTVSQINEGIATVIDSGNTLVWVEGEISNFKRASSGHCYMHIKDRHSQVPAVMWHSNYVKHKFEPETGMAVTVIATIRVYRKGGYYQLDIHRMQPSGVGVLFAEYEKLKKKLESEGLFDKEYKKPLPETVNSVGIITSKHGAAIQDIIKVISVRAPYTDIIVKDVPVQGDAAPSGICSAIKEMNEHGKVDCIILGRGGGSIEDLWAFNNENVARAVFASDIPIISAVGHEIDFTLSDFVADIRAPTPSAAAEIAVPDITENARLFTELAKRFLSSSQYYFSYLRQEYETMLSNLVFKRAVNFIFEARQECDALHEGSIKALGTILHDCKNRLSVDASRLEALSPLSVLARGYSIVTKEKGKPVRSSEQLEKGNAIHIKFHRGEALADVTSVVSSSENKF